MDALLAYFAEMGFEALPKQEGHNPMWLCKGGELQIITVEQVGDADFVAVYSLEYSDDWDSFDFSLDELDAFQEWMKGR